MSSSSEEELDELLRRQVIRQPRNFRKKKPDFQHQKSEEVPSA